MSARDHALFELDAKRLPGWPSGVVRGNKKRSDVADPRDRALAEQIVIGVVKNLLHLQHLIGHYAQRSLRSVDPVAQKILSIGLFQIRFLDRIPKPAAVHEAVEQCKRFGHGRAGGFVNAVLRKAISQALPRLPDRDENPADYAALALSHPKDLFNRLAELVGTSDALKLCEHDNQEPPTIVRLNSTATPEDLYAEGISVTPHEQPGCFIVKPARPAVLADWADRGIAQVQDPTASLVVPQLSLEAGQTALDRCCGLGTKTLQMRQAVGDTGQVIATDPSEARCQTLRAVIERRGIGNVVVRQIGMIAELPPEDPKQFDRILIDAPCSNSGVMARRPEARYHQNNKSLLSLGTLQTRILDDTAPALKTGGIMVYSTCSIWPEENQQRIGQFLDRHADYRLLGEQTTHPSLDDDPTRYHDGGYFAVLQRG